MLESEMPCW